MNKLFKILGLGIVLLYVSSCFDDKGNYDYLTLNEVYVDTVGADLTFTISQFDTLSIVPDIQFSLEDGDEAKLGFSWVMYKDVWSKDEADMDTLSHERNLHKQILQEPASDDYAVVLYVTDASNGIVSQVKYTVTILPSIVSGWMVLHTDENGESDFDYIATPYAVPTLDSTKHLHNIYSAVNGTKIQGEPRFIASTRVNNTAINYVYVATDEETLLTDATDFSLLYRDEDLYKEVPESSDVQYIGRGQECNYVTIMLDGGQVRNINNQASQYWDVAFSDKLDVSGDLGEVDLAPFVYFGDDCSSFLGHSAVMYDKLAQRFVRMPFSFWEETELLPMPEQNSEKFDVNNIGKDLIYLGKGFNAHAFALFTDGSSRELYRADLNIPAVYWEDGNELENEEVHDYAINSYDVSALPEIYEAQFYDCGPLGNFFLYASDQNIYVYSYAAASKVATLINDPFDADELITAVKIYNTDWYYPLDDVNGTLLYVATWNGTEGKLYEYKINRASGFLNNKEETNLKTPTNVFTGFGKIVDMCLKLEGIDD